MTPQTTPLDDLRRLGMMTAEVEAYTNCAAEKVPEDAPDEVMDAACDQCATLSPLGRGVNCADAALISLAAALLEMKGDRERLTGAIRIMDEWLVECGAKATPSELALALYDCDVADRDHEKETP